MSMFKSYWTVQGISPDARDAAIRAANADGEELGVWLSLLINKVSAAERNEANNANGADTADTSVDDEDDKLSSIERAMQQSRSTGQGGAN